MYKAIHDQIAEEKANSILDEALKRVRGFGCVLRVGDNGKYKAVRYYEYEPDALRGHESKYDVLVEALESLEEAEKNIEHSAVLLSKIKARESIREFVSGLKAQKEEIENLLEEELNGN